MRHGIPCMGSKSRTAKWAAGGIPASDAHAAILSNKRKRVIANDPLPAPNVFQDAIRGRLHNADTATTREQLLDSSDLATRLVHSFGNRTRGYVYSSDVERVKLAAERMAVAKTRRQRRLLCNSSITELEAHLHDGGTAERMRRLQALERLEGPQGLEASNLDHRDATASSGATAYADPPHRGTPVRAREVRRCGRIGGRR